MASNPLDGKTPSYFELAEMYSELWREMTRQRERAEKAERQLPVRVMTGPEAAEELVRASANQRGLDPDVEVAEFRKKVMAQ